MSPASPTTRDTAALKADALAALRELAALASGIGLKTLTHELETSRIPKLEEERFSIVVLGEFNHGKSSFVNALCGAQVLPTGVTPTTAALNHVVHAREPWARVHRIDGSSEDIPLDHLARWVTIDGTEAASVRYVEVGWPAPILEGGVYLVDTPGVNDINEQRAEITYGYIPRADVVLFLLDGTQVLKQSERSFLEQRVLRRSRDRLIFVLGKVDLLTPDELTEAVAYCREHLSRIIEEPLIFPVSSRRALSSNPGDRESSGVPALRSYLANHLAMHRGRLLVDNAIDDGLRTAGYLQQTLGIKRRSLELELDELERRVTRVRAHLEGTRESLRAQERRIRAQCDAVRAEVGNDVRDFVREFQGRIVADIERASAEDLQKYLHLFIQDTWKDWVEQEGDKIATRLESLVEELMQVTNDTVAEALRTVEKELGATPTRVEIAVDTLRYDVGVLALGAVGTGIFLFMNTLVGGLLTLAAPLVAVLLKERLSGQVRAQAAGAAPETIAKVGTLVEDKLGQIVEDFHGRLVDFLIAAGDALHRGIGELLDQALKERRVQGLDVATRTAELSTFVEQLEGVQKRLSSLRETLWASSIDSIDSPTSSAT